VKREPHDGTLCAKIFRLKRCGESTKLSPRPELLEGGRLEQ
jgi:hypothetical protein